MGDTDGSVTVVRPVPSFWQPFRRLGHGGQAGSVVLAVDSDGSVSVVRAVPSFWQPFRRFGLDGQPGSVVLADTPTGGR